VKKTRRICVIFAQGNNEERLKPLKETNERSTTESGGAKGLVEQECGGDWAGVVVERLVA
jgi:hypothetical protein